MGLVLLRKLRPLAADEVFQIDAHFPQLYACPFGVALACRGKALLPVPDFRGGLLDECGTECPLKPPAPH